MANIGYGYGSEWHLLHYLGRRRRAFTAAVEHVIDRTGVTWLDHEEYVDERTHFLRVRETKGLGFLSPSDPVRIEWEGLWPQTGNVHNWDAVGRAEDGSWVLVEAKAHLGEMHSSCGATAPESVRKIRAVLDETRRALGVTAPHDWAQEYYQYCNRLALLHYLNSRSVAARLVFVYFTGDRPDAGAPGRDCPADEAGWQAALNQQAAHAGVPEDAPIRARIHTLFLPAHHLGTGDDGAGSRRP